MVYNCSKCGTETKVDVTFDYEQVVCSTCLKFNNSPHNFRGPIKKSNLSLALNQKGVLFGIEYMVVGIVVKKHGATITWREYHLRSKNNDIAYLSEFDGHWVFLRRCDEKTIYSGKTAVYKYDTYRWYDDTSCHITHALGFFEKNLPLKTHRLYEYVLGTRILSSDDWEECQGEHISKREIKKAFRMTKMPNRSGIGLVQPYYFNIKGSAILLGLFLLFFIIIHFAVVASKTNQEVYSGQLNTFDNAFDEDISKSFSLQGGVAPLHVEATADVSNSWVNINIALVNEETNEILIANRDIEFYSGYEGGESWSEGSTKAKFNFCAIPAGNYHLVLNADNGASFPEPQYTDSSILLEPNVTAYLQTDSVISIVDKRYTDGTTNTYAISENSELLFFSQAKKFFRSANKELTAREILKTSLQSTNRANIVNMQVTWRPNNFWNLVVCSFVLIGLFLLVLWGRYLFEKKKWSNSRNSPYTS
jgi:hypothetical protein